MNTHQDLIDLKVATEINLTYLKSIEKRSTMDAWNSNQMNLVITRHEYQIAKMDQMIKELSHQVS